MTHPKHVLSINQLKLNIFLGWPKDEREQQQTVIIDIILSFSKSLAACESDKLDDTFCYAKLITQLRAHLHNQHFRLIEHLANTIFNWFKNQLPSAGLLKITLTKFPAIKELGSVSFSLEGEL